MSFIRSFKKWLDFQDFWKLRVDFYRDFAKSLEARELFRDFLKGELVIASNSKTRNKPKAKALAYAYRYHKESGHSPFEVLVQIMPNTDAQSLRVVQNSPNPVEALESFLISLDDRYKMRKEVRSALLAPSILLPIGIIFAWLIAKYSIPAFNDAAPESVWVGFAWFVREAALFFSTYGIAIFVLLISLIIWFIAWGLANITSKWRNKIENARGISVVFSLFLSFFMSPIIVLYRDIQSSIFLSNLATLLKSGEGLQDALKKIAGFSSPWMRNHIMYILAYVKIHPGDYLDAFSNGILNARLLGRMASKVRSDTGQDFSKVLIELGTLGQEETRHEVKKTALKANSLLLGITFSIILFFYIGQNYVLFSIKQKLSPENIQIEMLNK